ncbi:MAG: choice-of-anchor B family protein [Bacteroidota bacterium]
MNRFLLLFFLCLSVFGYSQVDFNLTLVGQNGDYANQRYNDIWGYVAPDGTEYAVIGSQQASIVYSLADPSNPEEVAYVPGAQSVWRDFKSFGEYIYFTTDEGEDGLGIINMTHAPDSITFEYWKPEITIGGNTSTLRRCHNLYIDEKGMCYLSGCRVNSGGVLLIDVATTPGSPQFVAASDARYSHDNFARGDTIYSADINVGFFSIIDASDPDSISTLAVRNTSSNFTHNCWLSDDGNYLFTTDERPNAYVGAYDISNITDISQTDRYRPIDTEGLGVIPHNTHYEDGYLVTSWYTDGLIVLDASRPNNLIPVAQYDTFDGPNGGFSGCWGAYPYLPSGLILASDVNSGLYVFEPSYQRAAFLEGTVTDATTGLPLPNARVEILDEIQNRNETDALGFYATGYHEGGIVEVRYSLEGYKRGFATVTLVNGEVTIQDIALEPIAPIATVSGVTIAATDGSPIASTQLYIINDLYTYEGQADENGLFNVNDIFPDTYEVYTGKWGYFQGPVEIVIDGTSTVEVPLTEGYQDDFHFDLGWIATADASTTSGFWERADPVGTTYADFFQSNPSNDVLGDLGIFCYTTGNGGENAGTDDIDDGDVFLTSPLMDLTIYTNPVVSYNLWFFNVGGTPPQDDRLSVQIDNGIETVEIELLEDEERSGWRNRSEIQLTDFIALTENMRISFISGDPPPVGHIVEAGVDAFLIEEGDPVNVTEIATLESTITSYPNPFTNTTTVLWEGRSLAQNAELQVYDILGRLMATHQITTNEQLEVGAQLAAGTYFLQLRTGNTVEYAGKIVKVAP